MVFSIASVFSDLDVWPPAASIASRCCLAFVTAEVVHRDNVAGRELRHEDLVDIGAEAGVR